MYQVPVLVIIYNKIFEAHNLFQVLRDIQPAKLYVSADGPVLSDVIGCQNSIKTRCVFMPEWPCEMKTRFLDEHLGKEQAIYTAIQWFFENEEEGVILFEDCLPCKDFFPYCAELLERYRDDKRIYHIGAVNFRKHKKAVKQIQKKHDGCQYFFSAYAATWGFATWRDRWADFDMNINLEKADFNKVVRQYTRRHKERRYWLKRFNMIKKTQVPIWDYEYNFHIWCNNGLSISPHINLVTNAGVRIMRTEHKFKRLIKKSYPIMPLKHPSNIVLDKKSDKFMFKYIYGKAYIQMFTNWINDVISTDDDKDEW